MNLWGRCHYIYTQFKRRKWRHRVNMWLAPHHIDRPQTMGFQPRCGWLQSPFLWPLHLCWGSEHRWMEIIFARHSQVGACSHILGVHKDRRNWTIQGIMEATDDGGWAGEVWKCRQRAVRGERGGKGCQRLQISVSSEYLWWVNKKAGKIGGGGQKSDIQNSDFCGRTVLINDKVQGVVMGVGDWSEGEWVGWRWSSLELRKSRKKWNIRLLKKWVVLWRTEDTLIIKRSWVWKWI